MIETALTGAVPQWLALATTLATGLGGGSLIKTILDHQRRKRAQTDDVAINLVGTLTTRISAVELDMITERATCERRIAALERQLSVDRAEHAALDQLRRHQVVNMRHAFDMALELIEIARGDPERIDSIVARMRDRRAEYEAAEALEKAAIASNRINNAVGDEPETAAEKENA